MKMIVLESCGDTDQLRYVDAEKPVLTTGAVLVEVKAISINPVDFKVRMLEPVLEMICSTKCPVVLGWDIAGTVVEVDDGVNGLAVGDRVFGMVNFPGLGNAYAEFVAAPASHLAKIPENTSFEDAAAATLAALTALQALKDNVKSGDRALIHAGSGGVGHYAIQIAKHLGAHVTTTCSAKNKDFVMGLGADEHIDYRTQVVEEVAKEMDFVLDGLGGENLTKSVQMVKDGGTIVSLPTPEFPEGVQEACDARNINCAFMLVQSSEADMATVAGMLADGSLTSHVSQTFDFQALSEAHAQLESGRTVGKVVVRV